MEGRMREIEKAGKKQVRRKAGKKDGGKEMWEVKKEK